MKVGEDETRSQRAKLFWHLDYDLLIVTTGEEDQNRVSELSLLYSTDRVEEFEI